MEASMIVIEYTLLIIVIPTVMSDGYCLSNSLLEMSKCDVLIEGTGLIESILAG